MRCEFNAECAREALRGSLVLGVEIRMCGRLGISTVLTYGLANQRVAMD